MLKRLRVVGFKTLRDFTVELSPVTVFVGANNVGKTNVLRALEFMANTVSLGFDEALRVAGGPESISAPGLEARLHIEVSGSIEGDEFVYSVGRDGEESLQINGASGRTMIRNRRRYNVLGSTTIDGDVGNGLAHFSRSPGGPLHIYNFIKNMRPVDFSPERLREASLPTPSVSLGREGQNLAAVLDRLAGERPTLRRRVDDEVHKAIANVESVITIPTNDGKKIVGVAEGDVVFRADAVSDGILLFIALSTVAQMSGGSTLVAIEELERGIHPRRIRETLDQILRVSRTGTQFLLTTHSPILLSEFRDTPEAVVILERDAQKGTTARRLSELPEVANATDVSLGDLWFTGVLGGVPAQ